jgi:hypothetical protein
MHQIVLGTFSPLFLDLFKFFGGSQAVGFDFQFPFPDVLLNLLRFFYVMTIPELTLDELLSDTSFDGPFSLLLLFSILSYLDEKALIIRVRAILSRRWPSGDPRAVRDFINRIIPEFQINGPKCVIDAGNRVRLKMNDLLAHWGEVPPFAHFVNPFAKVLTPSAQSFFLEKRIPFPYGPVGNLEAFLRKCRESEIDWVHGSFPPLDFTDTVMARYGVLRFVVQPWYPHFYDWAFHMDDDFASEHVVMGSPGIGKSVFGLYFMARLVAAKLPFFYGHDYFVVSWIPKEPKGFSKRCSARVALTGEVMPISEAEFQKEQDPNNWVFRLIDGWCYDSVSMGYPVLSIISPSQASSWKEGAVFRYPPVLTTEQCNLFSKVSTRYEFDAQITKNVHYPVLKYGTIRSRMQIAGADLRLVFGTFNLQALKRFA